MKKLRIEEVGDINSEYPYLEVFLEKNTIPFLEIAISNDKELVFRLYSTNTDVQLSVKELSFILSTGNEFLAKALKNEDGFLNLSEH